MSNAETINVEACTVEDNPSAPDLARESEDRMTGALVIGVLIGLVRELIVLSVVLAVFSGWVAFVMYLLCSVIALIVTTPAVNNLANKIPDRVLVQVGHPLVGASKFVTGLFARKAK